MDVIKAPLRIVSAFILMFIFQAAYAVESHTKLWTAVVATGPLAKHSKLIYFLEPELRFVDNKYKYQQSLLWLGIGYRVTPEFLLYVGDTPDVSRGFDGVYHHQNIVWQQLSWLPPENKYFKFVSRSRFEEIKRLHEGAWNLLLQQLFLFRFPFHSWPHHALILSDTVFFNYKQPPAWVNSSSFISQNRAVIGIETTVSKRYSYTVSYMNQYLIGNPNQMNNALVVTLNIRTT